MAGTLARHDAANTGCGDGDERYAFTHARHSPVYCTAPLLFRELTPEQRRRDRNDPNDPDHHQKRPRVIVRYSSRTRPEDSVTFVCPWALDGDDLRVLQFFVAAAGPRDRAMDLTSAPETDLGVRLRRALDVGGNEADAPTVVVTTTRREVMRETGTAWSAKRGRALIESLERMFATSVIERSGAVEKGKSRMLVYEVDEATDRLHVAVDPRIARAIAGRHTRIEMSEVRALKSGAARIVHQHLCAAIDPGCTGHVTLKTITGYLYADSDKITRRVRVKRQRRARLAVAEIGQLPGWKVAWASDTLAVERPGGGALKRAA